MFVASRINWQSRNLAVYRLTVTGRFLAPRRPQPETRSTAIFLRFLTLAEVNRFGTELLLSCYGFHKRKEASMNQDKNQDRYCPTCIHNVADWRLCSREDQEKLGVWTEPDGPCPGWEPKGGEDGRP